MAVQSQPDSETAGQPDSRTDFLEHRFSGQSEGGDGHYL